jgi:outer membrane immunogenic protein
MKKFLLGGIAAVALSAAGSAMAADLRVKAPIYKAPPPVVVYSWAGFYVGGNVGYSWGRASTNITVPDFETESGFGPLPVSGFSISDRVRPGGVIGGGQIGWNWQAARWVLGIEADLQASGQKDSVTRSVEFTVIDINPGDPTVIVSGSHVTALEAKLRWFGTVRGRVGYAWDGLLLYGTGGLAYGNFKLSGTTTTSGAGIPIGCGICPPSFPFADTIAFNYSKTSAGWTLGAGIEGAAWASNWTWKVEYLYIDLGTFDQLFVTPVGVVTTKTDVTDHILRVGLNYRLGAVGKDPVVARY